jgi:hypothetical protein
MGTELQIILVQIRLVVKVPKDQSRPSYHIIGQDALFGDLCGP